MSNFSKESTDLAENIVDESDGDTRDILLGLAGVMAVTALYLESGGEENAATAVAKLGELTLAVVQQLDAQPIAQPVV